jgi:glycosyltransferase involved in cell wall biosynthesis
MKDVSRSSGKEALPRISVVIPAYNEARYLGACLRSLRSQTYDGSYEVIVVDNGSSDETAEVARREGARVIFEPQRGVCAARERGTKGALGDIIVSTDADALFPEDWLTKIACAFDDDAIVAVAGPVQYLSPPWWGPWYSRLQFAVIDAIFRMTGRVLYVSACNLAFRKRTWRDAGGYTTSFTQGGDEYDFLRKIRPYGRIVFLSRNVVRTSSRRLHRGFFYNAFVTVGWYYLFDYALARIFGHSILGPYPAIRDEQPIARSRVRFAVTLLIAAFVTVLMVFHLFVPSHIVHAASRQVVHVLSLRRH